MNSIRSFIISSSIFLTVWLVASYTTKLEKSQPAPSVQQPSAITDISASTTADRQKDTHRVR